MITIHKKSGELVGIKKENMTRWFIPINTTEEYLYQKVDESIASKFSKPFVAREFILKDGKVTHNPVLKGSVESINF